MIQEKFLEETPREVVIYPKTQKRNFRRIIIDFFYITLAVFMICVINALIEGAVKIPF